VADEPGKGVSAGGQGVGPYVRLAGNSHDVHSNKILGAEMNQDQKLAFELHKIHTSNIVETMKPAIIFASEGIKSLQLCHGGALAAALAFAGAAIKERPSLLFDLKTSYICFGVGLTITLFVWVFAWLAQMLYKKSGDLYDLSFEIPYVKETEKSIRYNRFGDICRFTSFIFTIASCILFLSGILNMAVVFS
jgi:hypothetical protein